MEFGQLTNEIVTASEEHFLVDYNGPGEILVISFGFYDFGRNPGFDFYGRLRKMEVLSGRKLNKIFLRDKSSSWYHNGIPGLGSNAEEMTDGLKKIIEKIAPSQVITIGQSMGAYAAVLYGALLGADKVLAFGPLSTFHPDKLEVLTDRRWMEEAKRCHASRPEIYYEDLPELLKSKAVAKTEFDLFYGTKPGKGDDRSEGVNYDAAHALRFYGIPNVKFFPLSTSPHAIIQHLKDTKLIDLVLLNRIFGTKFAPDDATAPLQATWISWIRENLELGCATKALEDTLLGQNVTLETAQAAIARVRAEIEYKNLL